MRWWSIIWHIIRWYSIRCYSTLWWYSICVQKKTPLVSLAHRSAPPRLKLVTITVDNILLPTRYHYLAHSYFVTASSDNFRVRRAWGRYLSTRRGLTRLDWGRLDSTRLDWTWLGSTRLDWTGWTLLAVWPFRHPRHPLTRSRSRRCPRPSTSWPIARGWSCWCRRSSSCGTGAAPIVVI